MTTKKTCLASVVVVVASIGAIGCGGDPVVTDAGVDAPMGCIPADPPAIPDGGMLPAMTTCRSPTDGGMPGMGPCCYHASQMGVDDPELRLRYMRLAAPVGSPLTTMAVGGILNNALFTETFNWLIRVEGADADGPVMVRTGFGLGNADGTYTFPTGAGGGLDDPRYVPIVIPGTLTGNVVTTERHDGSLTVPVLNTAGTDVQLEFVLRNIQVVGAEFNTERSCVGFQLGASLYTTGAVLDGYIEVEPSRTAVVMTTTTTTTVCSAIASRDLSQDYCDVNDQSAWAVQPDALCDAAGCTANTGCDEDVCDRGADSTTGQPACNAWRLVANFAAQGIEITN